MDEQPEEFSDKTDEVEKDLAPPIKQIIPATGWFAVYQSPVDDEDITHHPLVAWGLTEGGDLVGMWTNEGYIIPTPIKVSRDQDFKRFVYDPEKRL